MAQHAPGKNFVQRHLVPASRLGDVLFALIMVLGATLTAGLTVAEGEKGVRQLLHSALGCNLAWGIIDGIMYVMNCITERSGKTRLIHAIRSAPDPRAALDIVREEIEPALETLAGPEDREVLYQSVLKHLTEAKVAKTKVTREDLLGALACFGLVFISCLPAAVPFLIFPREPALALRISNWLLIAMLFIVGIKWAKYAHANRLVAGLAMVAIGLELVGVAALLGG